MTRFLPLIFLAACATNDPSDPIRLPDGTSVWEARAEYPSPDYRLTAVNEGGQVVLYATEVR